MLTLEKIRTYELFKGDVDGWGRTHGRGDNSGIVFEDWSIIDQLCQSLYLLASGKASAEFGARLEQRLRELTTDEETRNALRILAKVDLDFSSP